MLFHEWCENVLAYKSDRKNHFDAYVNKDKAKMTPEEMKKGKLLIYFLS